MAKKKKKSPATIAQNKKARFDYHIDETFEAGLVLEGWEVKSIRDGRVQLKESYAIVHRGEVFLHGCHITPLISASTHINPQQTRERKLLLHRKEIDKLIGAVDRKGYTLVPLSLFWSKGKVKLSIGLGKGKKQHDKRATEKDRDWQRQKARTLSH
ncbi:MAG TPA: SsrA-binding protein [Gammaproteobacteria bacterium]|jgi:SsrA-binding protein|nr:SsrA-binding protein [Gammaproteobacteria bacterium]